MNSSSLKNSMECKNILRLIEVEGVGDSNSKEKRTKRKIEKEEEVEERFAEGTWY